VPRCKQEPGFVAQLRQAISHVLRETRVWDGRDARR
jgi:hypothetical protein